MKVKSIIMQCNVYLRYFRIESTEKREKKKTHLGFDSDTPLGKRRRDCELIENLLLTYIFNKHAVLSNRTRERTLTSKKVQLPIIIILIEIWFDSSRNWGDETILFAIDARNGYPNNKSQRSSSILAHSSLKKKRNRNFNRIEDNL